MKNKYNYFFISLIFSLFFLFLSSITFAQSAKIIGKVIDKDTDEALFGANVFIEGTSIGTATNRDGNYEIPIVPLGKHTLVFRFIGFQEQREDVELTTANRTIEVNVELGAEVLEGEEVIISAQALGQKQAINQQISARSIKNVVSSAKIEEIPDATAAESLGRLPGVSILRNGGEANKVSIRGLAPKFNNIQLDGVSLKSTDLNDRSTDISMISPNMLAGIEVTKALTADMEANSLGGTINLTIREAPDEYLQDLTFQGGYHGQSSEIANYKFVANVGNRFLDKKLGVFVNGFYERKNTGVHILDPQFIEDFTVPQEGRPNSAYFDAIRFTSNKELRERFGGTVVLDYRLPFGSLKFSNFASIMDRDIIEEYQQFSFVEEGRYNFGTTKGNKNEQFQFINRLAGNFDLAGGKLTVGVSHSLALREQPQSEYLGQYGNFLVSDDWQQGDYLGYVNHIVDRGPFVRPDGKIQTHLRNVQRSKDFGRNREFTANLEYEYPFKLGDITTGEVKFGGMYKHNSRLYDRRIENIVIDDNAYSNVWRYIKEQDPDVWVNVGGRSTLAASDAWDDHFDQEAFLDGKYALWDFFSLDMFDRVQDLAFQFYRDNNFIVDTNPSSFTNDQDGTENYTSGFIMSEFNILNNKVVFIPGVRYEKVVNDYSGTKIEIPLGNFQRQWEKGVNYFDSTAGSSHEHWFPSAHLRILPFDWMDIRLAYTNTVSRPDYLQLVPYSQKDPNATPRSLTTGNPGLKPQTSENYDAYLSFYSNEIGLASVGYFHKTVKDLLWRRSFFLPTADAAISAGLDESFKGYSYIITDNNDFDATLEGVEFEWQTQLWYLPFPFNGLVLSFNYTHMNSKTRYPYQLVVQPSGFPPPPPETVDSSYSGSVVGQPENIFNISLGYDYKGFSAFVTYLYQDGSLTRVDPKIYLSGYVFPYDRWDLKIRQKLPIDGLEVFFNLNNFTDTADETYFQQERYIDRQEFYGINGDLGIRYRL